jgi:hypothetical protein
MSTLSCPEVEERLDLYAAGECDDATGSAVEAHLSSCRECSQAFEESLRLGALLDVRFQEGERLDRLRQRIDAEARPVQRPRGVLPFVRRVGALAALLLLTFGLIGRIGPELPGPWETSPHLDLFASAAPVHGELERMAPIIAKGGPLEKVLTQPAHNDKSMSADEKHAVREAEDAGKLLEPTTVNLTLEVRNTGTQTVRVELGPPEAELHLDVRGPKVLVVTPQNPKFWPLPAGRVETLAPGKPATLEIKRLADQSGKVVRYFYLTAPGEYRVTIRYRTMAAVPGHAPRPLWVTGEVRLPF